MKAGESIFLYGPDPGKNASFRSEFPHPSNRKKTVRFVKNAITGLLYFNVHDFIFPYGNKKYIEIVKKILPKRMRNLKTVWMCMKAWKEIMDGLENSKEDEVISGWKEMELF